MNIVERLFYNISEIAVPVFFFISAFLFYYDYSKEDYKKKIKRRWQNLIIPYIFYCSIYYILFFYRSLNFIDFFFFIINGESFLWFIRDLIIYSFLANIILKCITNKKIVLLNIFGSFMLIILNIAEYKSIFYWWGIYLLGAYAGKYHQKFYSLENRIKKKISTKIIMLFILTIILFSFFMPNYTSKASLYISIYYIVFRYISLILFWLIILYFNNKIKIKEYMTNSFIVYCWHPVYIVILQLILDKIVTTSSDSTVMLKYMLTIVLSYLSICLTFQLIKKIFPKLAIFLNGNRIS